MPGAEHIGPRTPAKAGDYYVVPLRWYLLDKGVRKALTILNITSASGSDLFRTSPQANWRNVSLINLVDGANGNPGYSYHGHGNVWVRGHA
jgi:hypothetical protein